MAQKKKKDYKRSTYVETLDSVFSHYLRQKYADENGYVRCYTCDKTFHWKDIQCGHYFSRVSLATRWSESNCRPQCSGCNVAQHGNYPIFGIRLAQEIGTKGMEKLEQLHNKTVKLSNLDLLEMTKEYYDKLRWPGEISQELSRKLKKLKVI
jgi:hypothetical protein